MLKCSVFDNIVFFVINNFFIYLYGKFLLAKADISVWSRGVLQGREKKSLNSKTCVKGALKNRQNKDFNDKICGSLMQVKSIA